MIPPCFEQNTFILFLIQCCNGHTVAAYSRKVSGQSSEMYSRYIFCASHQTATLCRKGKTLLFLFIAYSYYPSILTQKLMLVNDFCKKSFAIMTREHNVEHLGVKGLIALDADFEEIRSMSVCIALLIALKKHGVSATLG